MPCREFLLHDRSFLSSYLMADFSQTYTNIFRSCQHVRIILVATERVEVPGLSGLPLNTTS